jgi:light-regulated signal transduction histidine kinase (bacteriophytochrome)
MFRLHGLLPSDFGGTLDALLKVVHPEDRAAFRAKLEEAVRTRDPFSSEHRIRRPDGETRRLHAFAKVTLDDDGRPERVVGVMQDVTERHRADEAIRDLNKKLQSGVDDLAAANKELEGFSYSVSHDLRAPLRAIDGFSRMLAEDCVKVLDERGQRYIKVIRQNTQKMGQLIDDLLAFSRLGRKPVVLGYVEMERLARGVYEELLAINPGRRIDFRVGALPAARGDVSMLRQVFANLIGNAMKYSRDRDPAVIEVEGRVEGAEAVYAVKDNGVGFEMEYAHKLFGVFQRLHSAKDFEGTGVGLVVQRHGGRVSGEGKPGQGATFTFTLPLREDTHERRTGDPAGGGQPGGRGDGAEGV